MTANEIIAWLNIFQLIATMFLIPAIVAFKKAVSAFRDIEKAIADLRLELHRDFVKKKHEHSNIRRIK